MESIGRRLAAEAVGTSMLLVAVVGSGIMGAKLAAGSPAAVHLALLANAIATGGALVALIVCFGPVSGAHFNPAVSAAMAWTGRLSWRDAGAYTLAQCAGAVAGVLAAHAMFELPVLQLSSTARSGASQWGSEVLATFGLLTMIFGCRGDSARYAPFVVGAWITGAYWFTSSTSFANPAVTLARSLTDTFSGILPADFPAFVAAQGVGVVLALCLEGWLRPRAQP